jgi:DUF4097 and DUF4098 domain-containing protein YvlB
MKLPRKSLVTAVAALLALSAAALPAAAREPRDTEQFDRTIPFHQGGKLKLNNFSGRVTITGTSGDNVVIHAVRRATRDRLDHIQIDVSVDASEVSIEANKRESGWREKNDNVVETDFEIQVPANTALDVKVFSSDIHVSGVSGAQKLHTFSGGVTVTDAAAAMDAETFSGDIDVNFAGAINGQVDFDSFSGRLRSDRPVTLRSSSRRSRMKGEIGSGGDTVLRFHTFSGDVTLR